MAGKLTHIDGQGRARMVDIGDKDSTARTASARGIVRMGTAAYAAAMSGGGRKGDPLRIAEIAGIMGAKKTADLIPLCHPLALTGVTVEIVPLDDESGVEVTARVRTEGRTGVEMEALTAVSAACLTVYDMLKAVDKSMVIERIELLTKSGGVSGEYDRSKRP